MKTVVYQSYRTHDVPGWIARCMESVRLWARQQGFAYRFIDDRMFDHVPAWYRRRVQDHVLLVSDLARLNIARQFLAQDFERAVWIDADVVVFDPQALTIPIAEEYAFCREIWVYPGPDGAPLVDRRVCNAVAVFVRGNSILDFYIHACQMIVSRRTELSVLDIGTRFLSRLHEQVPFPLLDNIGLFSPAIMADLVRGTNLYSLRLRSECTVPLCAANLCSALRHQTVQGVRMSDEVFDTVVATCLDGRGQAVNRTVY